MQLSARQAAILGAVVESYIADQKPVSSAQVARRLGHDAGAHTSPATIRGELVRLEAHHLLTQPHTSAGRVPTELGFRTYVDQVMTPRLHPWDRVHLDEATRSPRAEDLPAMLGQAIAELSGEVALIGVPRFAGSTFREIGLAVVGLRQLVVYFVSPGGQVQQRMVDLDFDLGPGDLARVQNYLNHRLTQRTLAEIRELLPRELAREETRRDHLLRRALEIGLRALPEPETELLVEGASKLATKPEFADHARLQDLLEVLEAKRLLLQLLERVQDGAQVTVMLGSEHHLAEISYLALVGGICRGPAGRAATIGILGPARMDYGRLVPMVGYAKDLFERQLKPF